MGEMGKMKVFLDTNVVVDLLGERKPFFDDAVRIVEMHRRGFIRVCVSSLTVVNCAYILQKAYTEAVMMEKVRLICNMFDVMPIDNTVIMKAIESGRHDFEDAVQYFSAMRGESDVIVTRDRKGFMDFDTLVMTPSEFVAASMKN